MYGIICWLVNWTLISQSDTRHVARITPPKTQIENPVCRVQYISFFLGHTPSTQTTDFYENQMLKDQFVLGFHSGCFHGCVRLRFILIHRRIRIKHKFRQFFQCRNLCLPQSFLSFHDAVQPRNQNRVVVYDVLVSKFKVLVLLAD